MNDTSQHTSQPMSPRTALLTGLWLLAFSLPLGLTLEALHAMKVQVYLGSATRREMWTLAHAHGNLLGILCLVISALGPRLANDLDRRRRHEKLLSIGAVLMPLGFLLGGVLNSEGDPSLGILLVPVGGVLVFVALVLVSRSAVAKPD
ncbi:MAG: hypothetical protein ABIP94_13960 [Planctomycetota bacterium]